MREHLGFLKTSSAVVKVAAWIFLFLGGIGGVSIIFGLVPGNPRWMGGVVLAAPCNGGSTTCRRTLATTTKSRTDGRARTLLAL